MRQEVLRSAFDALELMSRQAYPHLLITLQGPAHLACWKYQRVQDAKRHWLPSIS